MNNQKRNTILLSALTALLLVSLACGSSVSPTLVATSVPPVDPGSQQQEQPTQVPTPVAQQNYKVGDVIAIGDNVFVVLGWENVPASDFSAPEAGKKFVAVELLIVNKSQSAMSISTLLQMSMKDDTSQKYDVDFMASTAVGGGSLDGELATGEKLSGTVKVEPPAELAGETAQQTYNVGNVIAMGTTNITVNEVLYPTGDEFNKPNAGFKFLVVDLTIENLSATAISVSSLLQMSVKDSSSQKYDVDLMASVASGGSSPEGEIAPGEKLRGQVGFQIPESAAGLVFVFDADVWGSGKVFVALP
jgi:hypothetical protein